MPDNPYDIICGPHKYSDQLYHASFRGVPFAVSEDSIESGRRVVTHEYPGSEVWDNEDLGRRYFAVEVRAYVYGYRRREWHRALVEACTTPGSGILILPDRGPMQAICLACRSSFNEDKTGKLFFDLAFTLDSTPPQNSGQSIQSLRSRLNADAKAAQQLNIELFGNAYEALGKNSIARRPAASAILQAASDAMSLISRLNMREREASKIYNKFNEIFEAASDYSYSGNSPANIRGGAGTTVQIDIPPSFARHFSEAVDITMTSPDKQAGAGLFKILAQYEPNIDINGSGRIATAISNAVESITAFVRRTAILASTRFACAAQYSTKTDALEAMKFVNDALVQERDAAEDSRLYDAIDSVMASAIMVLRKAGMDAPGVKSVSLTRSLPAPVIAAEYYGSLNKLNSLIERNGVLHPLYCPLELELESPQ